MVTGEDRATDPDDARATAFSVYLSAVGSLDSETQNERLADYRLRRRAYLTPADQSHTVLAGQNTTASSVPRRDGMENGLP